MAIDNALFQKSVTPQVNSSQEGVLNQLLAAITGGVKQILGAGTAPVRAALTTAVAGTNNDLVFTARHFGTSGNAITVAYVNPLANNAALQVSVVGKAITVRLATGAGGAITSTAAQVSAAILASAPATELVSVANAAANDGTGVVAALAATPLAGGTNGVRCIMKAGNNAFAIHNPTDAAITAFVQSPSVLNDGGGQDSQGFVQVSVPARGTFTADRITAVISATAGLVAHLYPKTIFRS
jgi:hypothetical protein